MTQAMWPDHCLQDGDSELAPALITEDSDMVVPKVNNEFADDYSAFMDNTKTVHTELDKVLRDDEITTLYIVGIARRRPNSYRL